MQDPIDLTEKKGIETNTAMNDAFPVRHHRLRLEYICDVAVLNPKRRSAAESAVTFLRTENSAEYLEIRYCTWI